MEKIYPAWRHHKEKESKIVYSEEQDMELGLGWVDHPNKLQELPEKEISVDAVLEEKEALVDSGEAKIPDEAVIAKPAKPVKPKAEKKAKAEKPIKK